MILQIFSFILNSKLPFYLLFNVMIHCKTMQKKNKNIRFKGMQFPNGNLVKFRYEILLIKYNYRSPSTNHHFCKNETCRNFLPNFNNNLTDTGLYISVYLFCAFLYPCIQTYSPNYL